MRLGDKHPTFLAAKADLAEVEDRIRTSDTTSQHVMSVALDNFAAEIAIPAQEPVIPASPNPKAVYAIAVLLGLILVASFRLIDSTTRQVS
jgi:hypothetical protein